MNARLVMFVRFADGTGRQMHDVEDTLDNRRAVDRMAAHMMARRNVASVDVDVVVGRTAGYARSRGSYR